MKTKKVLKRIAKIEALISKVTDRSSASPKDAWQDRKFAWQPPLHFRSAHS